MYGTELVKIEGVSTGQDLATAGKMMMKKDAETDTGAKPTGGILSGSLNQISKSMSLLIQVNLLSNEIQ